MSVGHLARLFEQEGIATVIIAVKAFQDVLRSMSLPRVFLTRHPMGRPIGFPGNRDQHTRVITSAMKMLTQKKEAPGILYSEEPYLPEYPD